MKTITKHQRNRIRILVIIFLILKAKSTDLEGLVNEPKPLNSGLTTLFAIGIVSKWRFFRW